jgi:hypothetical protein
LTPSVSFARKGGRNTGGVEIEESNLLGTGSEVKLGFKFEIDRDETFFAFNDGQLGENRFELGLGAADNSETAQLTSFCCSSRSIRSMHAGQAGSGSIFSIRSTHATSR